MPLPAGIRLGPYEILSAAGAGGMGEVYRARDTRLDRVVAIKILPQHLASTPEVKQRFEREARAVSSLSHPNICVLHDIGHDNGTDFLVMEFLEGETLAERLTRGPLPLEELLRVAMQIGDALDKAHRRGVVHRDLKPGNIILTKSGAKLLDFGLAKTVGLAPSITDLTSSPTVSKPLTAEGTIVGTFQYMSPEQLEGKDADARSDVFAFGAVLYEMATGKKAFSGPSQASLIASIMERDPQSAASLQPMIPPALNRLIKTCLEKNPDERRQTMHDVLLELRWIAEGGSQAGVPAPVVAHRRSRERIWAIAAAALLVSTLALGWMVFGRASAPEPQIFQANILPPENSSLVFSGASSGGPVISPDGRKVIYSVRGAQEAPQLWMRHLDAAEATPLPGTARSGHPFWSPDSKNFAFYQEGKLRRMSAEGGPSTVICDAEGAWGGSWNAEDVIIFVDAPSSGVKKVSANGGAPTPLTQVDANQLGHRFPQFLPDGRNFIYFAASSSSQSEAGSSLFVASLEGGKPQKLVATDAAGVYAEPGYLLFVRENTLMAQAFDADRMEVSGEAVPLLENIAVSGGFRGIYTASNNHVLAFQSGNLQRGWNLALFDREGRMQGPLTDMGVFIQARLSPNGQDMVGVMVDKGEDLWIFNRARKLASRFTFDGVEKRQPMWSPDGAYIAYSKRDGSNRNLYKKKTDGSGGEELLLASDQSKAVASWSRDGRYIVFMTGSEPRNADIWVLPLFGDGKPYALLDSQFSETGGALSPDGKWLAYVSNESGRGQIYITTFPAKGGKWQISADGGIHPRWRGDGRELYFIHNRGVMAAEISFTRGHPEVKSVNRLFESEFNLRGVGYDVTADGKLFVIGHSPAVSGNPPVTILVNWPAKLRKK